MDQAYLLKHYYRAIALCREFNIDFFSNVEHNPTKKKLKLHKRLKSQLEPTQFKMLREVVAIENEKLTLRDDITRIPQIFEQERVNFKRANELLKMDFEELKHLKFKINPMVNIYESDWPWVYRELDLFAMYEIQKNRKKGDYYFLFERKGIYDYGNETNVLEYPLTIYEYAFLQEFEKFSYMASVMEKFLNIYNSELLSERKSLDEFFINTTKKLIFKMFIICTK